MGEGAEAKGGPGEAGREPVLAPAARDAPDPVIGAGITLLGIFLMGTGGAHDLHYVFDVGVLVAMSGAVVFVLFVALSAMKQRKQSESRDPER